MERVDTEYEEIRDSRVNIEESVEESSWSKDIEETSTDNAFDAIHYYIQPVNEYENSELKVYENYLQSGGYEEAVYSPKRKSKSSDSSQDLSQDEYEVPVKEDNVIKYDILSRSPVEFTLFVEL